MAAIPETSTTLLKDLASDTQHARWAEFVSRYRPMMEAYMRDRYPTIDGQEVIQRSLISLIRTFPVYHYCPEETGLFRNYLIGVLRHRAVDLIREQKRRNDLNARYSETIPDPIPESDDQEGEFRRNVLEIAMQQLLADDAVRQHTKEIFVRVAVKGESPSEVATAFGMTRNAVDQIKNRMVARLREYADRLIEVDEHRD